METPTDQEADAEARIRSQVILGDSHYARRDYVAALAAYERALKLAQGGRFRVQRIHIHRSRGLAYRRLGQYRQALESLRLSEESARLPGEVIPWIQARANIAAIQELRGRYGAALKAYRSALDAFQRADEAQDAIAVNLETDIALVNAELGRHDEAYAGFDRALSMVDSRRNDGLSDRLKGRILHNYGYAMHKAERHQDAITRYRSALTYRFQACDLRGAAKSLNSLALSLVKLGRCDGVLSYLKTALALNRHTADRPTEARTLDVLGEAHLCAGDTDSALECLQWSLSISQHPEIDDRGTQVQALIHIADVYQTLGKRRLEIIYLKRAVHVIEYIRAELGTLPADVRSSFDASVEGTYRRLVALLLEEGKIEQARQVIEMIQLELTDEFLEGLSYPSLEENVQSSRTALAEMGSALPFRAAEQKVWDRQMELLASASDTALRLGRLEEQEKRLKCLGAGSAHPECALLKRRLGAEEERRDLLRAEFSNFSQLAEIKDALNSEPEDVDLDNLQGLMEYLPDDSALLYPFILEDRLVLILMVSGIPPVAYTRRNLKPETIATAVRAFRRELQDPSSDPRASARRLNDWLIGEEIRALLDQQNIRTIVYVPDGVLRYIPLAALHDGDKWLVEDYSVMTITNNSIKHLGRERRQFERILAAATTKGGHSVTVDGQSFAFSALPGADAEVENLARTFQGRVKSLRDQEFSASSTPRQFRRYQLVHLATHAKFTPGKGHESSFILFGDGTHATVSDIGSWTLDGVELFALSACETGIGDGLDLERPADGREILGFGYQVQAAGAKSVLASLWPVSDGGTQALMSGFYRALKQGESKTEALSTAQRNMLDGCLSRTCTPLPGNEVSSQSVPPRGVKIVDTDDSQGGFSHPFFWAPFLLIGNGD